MDSVASMSTVTSPFAQLDSHVSNAALIARLSRRRDSIHSPPVVVQGKLTRMVGLTLEAVGCQAAVGSRCIVQALGGDRVEAEVVGFSGDRIYLMPVSDMRGLAPNSRVIPSADKHRVPVGDALLGRVLDATGRPLDGAGVLRAESYRELVAQPVNPLMREPIRESLDVGVRAINGLLRVGRGQRLGLFAGSGVGKSTLLGMMTRHTRADVVVVGLIGERGREVNEFVRETLGPLGMAKAVVVAAPADTSPVSRLHGAMFATTIAEHFRDQGRHVLLLMDSLTRFAQAQREIALAVGEPPATKGYPPSVFAKLPLLVERAGTSCVGGGSITAFYTVLTEGDDPQDPIADSARAILDGHIVLSREVAELGRYPAIDMEASVSRLLPALTSTQELAEIARFRRLCAVYRQNQDLVSLGVYQRGSDAEIDAALEYRPSLEAYLSQTQTEAVSLEQSAAELKALLNGTGVAVSSGPKHG
jgi:flagellum-specific ATP synthase